MPIGLIVMAAAAAAAPGPDCAHIGESANWFRTTPEVARPGDVVTLDHRYSDGPYGDKPVPAVCIRKIAVTGPARVARDGTLRIDPRAAAGSVVEVRTRIGRADRSQRFTIVGRNQQVLTGTWHLESAEHCRRAPAEFVFSTEGRYSYTFAEQMVETMTSGGGAYRWDSASGVLDLGNGRPPVQARREGARLVIEGLDFDVVPSPPFGPAPPPCILKLRNG